MIYVLYGENESEINKFIDSIMKENNIDSRITYDYKECSINDVIEEASYFDLFGNKKLIILSGADFLTTRSTLDSIEFDKYINSPNESAILVLKVITEKLDERKKLVKTLRKHATVKEFKLLDEKNIDGYVRSYFDSRNYKIGNDGVREIVRRLKNNTKVIDSELEKLVLYKLDAKEITLEDVKHVVTMYEENNIFSLVDAVVKKDKNKIFSLYKSLIEDREEPAVILVMLANQFRLMYQAKVLNKSGLDKYKISELLKEHNYRVGLAIENSLNISEKELTKILHKLSLVDIEIKTGVVDKTKALETFFLEL